MVGPKRSQMIRSAVHPESIRHRLRNALREAEEEPPEALAERIASVGDRIVYFVQAGDFGPIKIGLSRKGGLEARLQAIQTGCPWPIRLTRVVPGDGTSERLLHLIFAPLWLQGEWFHPDPVLADVAWANTFDGGQP